MDISVIILLVISIITFLGRTVLAAFSQDINIVNSFATHNTHGMIKHIILNIPSQLFLFPLGSFISLFWNCLWK